MRKKVYESRNPEKGLKADVKKKKTERNWNRVERLKKGKEIRGKKKEFFSNYVLFLFPWFHKSHSLL